MSVNLDRLLGVLYAAREVCTVRLIAPSPEAAQALQKLSEAIQRYDTHEENVLVSTKPCDFCRTPIFFAQFANGRFLPFETETVPAETMVASWRYVISFDNDPPRVTVRPTQDAGEVYVNHQHTCGASAGPKVKIASLVRRWKANCENNATVDVELVRQLLALREGLRSSAEQADI